MKDKNMETLEKRIDKFKKQAKGGDKEEKKKVEHYYESKPQPSIVLEEKPKEPHKPRKRCCK